MKEINELLKQSWEEHQVGAGTTAFRLLHQAVTALAAKVDEPRRREIHVLEIHESAQNLTGAQAYRLAQLRK